MKIINLFFIRIHRRLSVDELRSFLRPRESMPARLAPVLRGLGHDANTVADEGLAGRNDPTIWRAAQEPGRFLVTQDLDFADIRLHRPGTHEGVLLVRLRAPGREALIDRVAGLFRHEPVERWGGCFIVATERKLRIHRPSDRA